MVHYDIWKDLHAIRLKDPDRFRTLEEVIEELLKVVPDVSEDTEVSD